MKNFLNKYALLCVMLILLLILFMVEKKMAIRVIKLSSLSVKEMLMVIPPIFLMLGLLDTWVSKEKMARFMGKGSG
ncbi:MAG TPA: permease, partial [Candidatus Cloacimonadota bacterium]|nr:permease [Candidatus Cloacimonadota bacterium]